MESSSRALFASITYDGHRNKPPVEFKRHDASVSYSHFAAQGMDIRLGDATNHGHIDTVMLANGRLCVFEFEVEHAQQAKGEAAALKIKAQGYDEKYRSRRKSVYLVGRCSSAKSSEPSLGALLNCFKCEFFTKKEVPEH